jgi:hypothetical protein
MLLFILNLSGPVFTLLLAIYAILLVYVLVSIAKSDHTLGTKIILLVVMIAIPLAPIFYLIMNSRSKVVGKTK